MLPIRQNAKNNSFSILFWICRSLFFIFVKVLCSSFWCNSYFNFIIIIASRGGNLQTQRDMIHPHHLTRSPGQGQKVEVEVEVTIETFFLYIK